MPRKASGNYGDTFGVQSWPQAGDRFNPTRSARVRSHFRAKIPVRLKTNFISSFNPITPVQISREKYSALRSPQITSTLPRIPPHEEGCFAIVTNVEAGSGGRDGSRAFLTPTNELIRLREDGDGMVPTPSCTFSHKAFADGQAVWSWRPDAGAKSSSA
jgi:hypothetical protein